MSKIDDTLTGMAGRMPGGTLEALSAYMDGELPPEQRDGLLQAAKAGTALCDDWSAYHCVGDVLRSDDTAFVHASFVQRFKGRLDAEPFLFAPEVSKAYAAQRVRSADRWRMPLSVAAGIAAVMVVGVLVVPQRAGDVQPSATAPAVATALEAEMASRMSGGKSAADSLARPVSSEYLMAHRNYSAGLAMRGVVSHVRTAGYDGK